jgi:hypothetical protein
MDTNVMRWTQWQPEPRRVMVAPDVVPLDMLGCSAHHAAQRRALRGWHPPRCCGHGRLVTDA